jgi:hypothetical protein
MDSIGQYEWAVMLLLVLGLAVWELLALRRAQRRDREKH